MCATEPRPELPVWRAPRRHPWWRVALVLTLLSISIQSHAQQAPSRDQEQIRRLRQQVQQLQQAQQEATLQQQALQKARSEADQRTAKAQGEAARVRSTVKASNERVSELQTELGSLRTAHNELQAREARLVADLAQARGSLSQVRADLAERVARLQQQDNSLADLDRRGRQVTDALALCSRNNQALRSVGLELLDRWQRHDWRDFAGAKEPFLQLKRVEIENLVQGYEERIDKASLAAVRP